MLPFHTLKTPKAKRLFGAFSGHKVEILAINSLVDIQPSISILSRVLQLLESENDSSL